MCIVTTLEGVVIDAGVVNQVHLHVSVLNVKGKVTVNVAHNLIEGVEAVDGRSGLLDGNLNGVGGLTIHNLLCEHVAIAVGVSVLGSAGGELVNEHDAAQVDGIVLAIVAKVATSNNLHVVAGTVLLVVIGNGVANAVAVNGELEHSNGDLHVLVVGVEAIEHEGVLAIVDTGGGECVEHILVLHVQEVAVVVQLDSALVVALIVVEVEAQEVVGAGDDDGCLVGPCNEHVMLAIGGNAVNDVGDGVAVLVLGHGVGVRGLTGHNQLIIGLIAALVGQHDVNGVGLGNLAIGHGVER